MADNTKQTLDDSVLDEAARVLDKLRKALITLQNEGIKKDKGCAIEFTAEDIEELKNALLTGITGIIFMDTVNSNVKTMNETTTDPFEDDMK